MRLSYSGFLGGLLVLDGLLIGLFGVVLRPPAAASSGDDRPAAAGAWGGVDAAAAGREVGELFLAVRRQVLPNRRLELAGMEVSGPNVVMRLGLKAPARGANVTFPGTLYCADCERQSCQFDKATRGAIEVMARAFPADSLRALAKRVGPGRLGVSFAGAADDDPLEPTTDERYCVGANFKTFEREVGFDKYANKCGAHACQVGGQTLRVGSGDIDDPRKLACLRAFCLHRASTLSEIDDVEATFAGLLERDGAVEKPLEVTLVLRDLAAPAHRAAFDRFTTAYRSVVGEWDPGSAGKPSPAGATGTGATGGTGTGATGVVEPDDLQ